MSSDLKEVSTMTVFVKSMNWNRIEAYVDTNCGTPYFDLWTACELYEYIYKRNIIVYDSDLCDYYVSYNDLIAVANTYCDMPDSF